MAKEFDISIAIDKASYLNPQIYMLIDTMKDKLPDDTIVHVTTNRSRKEQVIKYIKDNVPTKIYIKPKTSNLISRCRYLMNAVDVKTEADYLVRMDVDMLALKHLDWITEQTKHGYDIVIQGENRRIIKDDMIELRIWRHIYRAMGIKMPDYKIHFIENHEEGRPLFNTGFMIIKSDILPTIRERWKPLTKICEKWIQLGIHSNEFAMTGLIMDEGWNWGTISGEEVFNPISHYRKGEFPSTELVDDCVLPDDVEMLHWHHSHWIQHIARFNPNIRNIIQRNDKYIPKEWWKRDSFKEQQEE